MTTPLIVSNQQKLVGAAAVRGQPSAGPGTASVITSTWTDPNLATVMEIGGNAVSIDGVGISGSGHALAIIGSGALQIQNVALHNMSVVTNDVSETYCALVMRGIIYNFDSDNVYYNGGLGSVCTQYDSGGTWTFRGSRWDDRVSAWVSTTGFTDRDRLQNYPGFPNGAAGIHIHDLFTEGRTGIVFDALNHGITFGPNFFTADVAANPGTLAVIRVGRDSFGGPGSGYSLTIGDSPNGLAGSTDYTQQIYVASNVSNGFGPIVIRNSAIRGNINLNNFNPGVYVYGYTDLCLDPACNPPDGGQILNRASGFNGIFASHVLGARDSSSVPDVAAISGRYLIQFPQDNWAKRRRWFFDTNTDNNYFLNPPGNDTVTTISQADVCVDNAGNSTFRTSVKIGSGQKVSGTLQAQAALTFGAISAQTCGNKTVSLSGAATSNGAFASPNYAVEAGLSWSAFVSASGTVTLRLCNVTSGSITPASSSNWRVWVVQE